MFWLGPRHGFAIDWLTQKWVALSGKCLSLHDVPWLDGPVGNTDRIGASFFAEWARLHEYTPVEPTGDEGLLRDGLDKLLGPDFEPRAVHPQIDDFYRHTASYNLTIESRWLGPFWLFGAAVAWVFSRRLAQLNLPLSAEGSRAGLESRVECYRRESDEEFITAWIRVSRQSGRPAFVGQYGTATIPGCGNACIKVVFPLPNGSATIFLRPKADSTGDLSLVSDGRAFGDPGFYFSVIADNGKRHFKYVSTMKEQLCLVSDGKVIRAQHSFRVFGLPFLRLHYQIEKAATERL